MGFEKEVPLGRRNSKLLLPAALLLVSASPVLAQATNTDDIVDVTTNDTVDVTTDATTRDAYDDEDDSGKWGWLGLLGLAGLLGLKRRDHDRHTDDSTVGTTADRR